MCGICGIAASDPRRPVDEGLIERMAAALVHRGPDGQGTFVSAGIGFGVRRLAIVDLESGDQPIANEDGSVVVVCNGEIYNHVELRAELIAAGHRFRTRSDVESIEMLCGYSWYRANRRLWWISRFLGGGARLWKWSSRRGGRERTLRLMRVAAGPGPERFQAVAGPLWSEDRRRFNSMDLARAIDANPISPPPTPPELVGRHPVEWLQYWDITTRMHDHIVQTLDRHSMAWSVEVRVPFLDHEIAEWCLAMPPGLKQARPEKRVLRRALADDLPPEILGRRKRGLSGPSASWLRGEPPPFVEELLSPGSLRAKGWFDPEHVARTREMHRTGEADRSRQLSAVLQVQAWDEIFLCGRSPDDFDVGTQ